MKKIFILFAILTSMVSSKAQEVEEVKNFSVDANAMLTSKYIWRGVVLDEAPNFQAGLNFNIKDFTAGFWGSSNFDGSYMEYDFAIAYSLGNFSFGITDYFIKGCDPVRWTNFKKDETSHVLEANLAYEFDFGLDAQFNLMFGGADKLIKDNLEVKNAYSSYLEFGYNAEVSKILIRPYMGFTFSKTYQYGNMSAEHGFNMVNLGVSGTYNYPINDKLSLPISTQFGLNPQSEEAHFCLTLGLEF